MGCGFDGHELESAEIFSQLTIIENILTLKGLSRIGKFEVFCEF